MEDAISHVVIMAIAFALGTIIGGAVTEWLFPERPKVIRTRRGLVFVHPCGTTFLRSKNDGYFYRMLDGVPEPQKPEHATIAPRAPRDHSGLVEGDPLGGGF